MSRNRSYLFCSGVILRLKYSYTIAHLQCLQQLCQTFKFITANSESMALFEEISLKSALAQGQAVILQLIDRWLIPCPGMCHRVLHTKLLIC